LAEKNHFWAKKFFGRKKSLAKKNHFCVNNYLMADEILG